MVTFDAERTRHGAAGNVHDHGHAGAGLDGELLQSIQKSIGAGCVKNSSAACGRTVADSGSTVLALSGNQPDPVFSLRPHQVKLFCNLRGGGDGVIPHYMIINLCCGVGGKLVATLVHDFLGCGGSLFLFCHRVPPSTGFSGKNESLVIQELGPLFS